MAEAQEAGSSRDGNPAPSPDMSSDTDTDVPSASQEDAARASVAEGIHALIEDGKTYAEAEFAFQKARLGYAADSGRQGLAFGLIALGFTHLALIALVVGVLIGLVPLFGIWGAILAVTGGLLVAAVIAALLAKSRFGRISQAFEDEDNEPV